MTTTSDIYTPSIYTGTGFYAVVNTGTRVVESILTSNGVPNNPEANFVEITESQYNSIQSLMQNSEYAELGTDGSVKSGGPALAPLSVRAQQALVVARKYVSDNFLSLGETPSQAWIDYQKALIAIENGTDTKSTALPAAPAS